jgi:4a-hydroxytetrahydrobiopterin dehydratase
MSDETDLEARSCVPCRGGVPTLTDPEIQKLMPGVPGWRLVEVEGIKRIEKTFEHRDFLEAMKFVNRVADVSERQGHHPDLHIHWNKVRVEFWTHKIKGLHENDFIMAAKVERLTG